MERLYRRHHWEATFCPLLRGAPNSGASSTVPVGVLLHNWAIEAQSGHVFTAFDPLLYAEKAN